MADSRQDQETDTMRLEHLVEPKCKEVNTHTHDGRSERDTGVNLKELPMGAKARTLATKKEHTLSTILSMSQYWHKSMVAHINKWGRLDKSPRQKNFTSFMLDTLPLRKWSLTPHSLSMGCEYWVTSFLKIQYKSRGVGGEWFLQWKKLTVTTSATRSRLASTMNRHADGMCPWYDVIGATFTTVVFCPPPPNP